MRKVFSILMVALLFFLNSQGVLAANTTMGISPQSGSFDKPFTVNLVIDGHGDKFNAAEATIKTSSSVKIKDLTLGDCNFSFLHTPTVQNPSFSGIILSSHSTKCTVYVMTLTPVSKGNASISLSKVSVRRYGDAVNVLSSTTNGSYAITEVYKTSSVLGSETKNVSKDGLYSVFLNISSKGNKPVYDATVILSPVSKKDQKKATTDSKGAVRFLDVKPGIYSVIVEKDRNKLGETIINVSGSNHVLTFGINLDVQKNNPLMKNANSLLNTLSANPLVIIGFLVLAIITGISIALFVFKSKSKKTI